MQFARDACELQAAEAAKLTICKCMIWVKNEDDLKKNQKHNFLLFVYHIHMSEGKKWKVRETVREDKGYL